MATTNRDRMQVLLVLLEKALRAYVTETLESRHGKHWRQTARLPNSLSPMADLDAHACLYALIHNWRDTYENLLKPAARDAASAAMAGRNAAAHSSGTLDEKVTLRALSGGEELLTLIGAKNEAVIASKHLDDLQQEMVYKKLKAEGKIPKDQPKASDDAAKPETTPTAPKISTERPRQEELLGFGGGDVEGLQPWRTVMPPREDVLAGRLEKDSFAANLSIADRDYRKGSSDSVHADPRAFFESTHLTRGLQLVLDRAAKRFMGGDAPSTIGLQTNFGGGKTHTLLSLLHMANSRDLTKSEALGSVRSTLGRDTLPNVRTAVFSGVDKGPDVPLDTADGEVIRTLWGYIAWHLAGHEGLDLVRSSEEAGTNPGAETMQRVLELTGDPSLILLDELVVFVRQLSGERFEAHLSFLQSLTEAAIQVPNALIVGSLPESDIEAGQDQGREALRRLEKLFGRVQSAWEPAQGTETYAVVRRRLFQEIDTAGERERKRTVERFRKMYRDNKNDFPAEVSRPDYLEKMMDAYPVHPMLFDTLADDWGPLEKFQRTRGVLSLIARAIYTSYMDQSDEPLILPSSVRIDDTAVKGALIEPLEGGVWSSIVDGEVDGDRSLTWSMEKRSKRYGNSAVARRAARAVFLATAPGDGSKSGMTGQELRLACTKPGEQTAIFGDALRELSERSAHLYTADGRYWYGAKATLNKTAQQREGDIDDETADNEIIRLLREDNRKGEGGWSRVHVAPDRASDAADERSSALVILGPQYPQDDGAEVEARDGLERRSGGQRRYRNSLIFLAADTRGIDDCRRLTKRSLAWRGIISDDALDLTASQRKDAKAQEESASRTARDMIRKAWHHIFVPEVDVSNAGKAAFASTGRRVGGQRSAATQAWETAKGESFISEKLGATTLAEKIKELWPADHDSLSVDKVRDWYFEHLHMERVRDESVISDAIADAASAALEPHFGLAAGSTENGFVGLTLSKNVHVTFGTGMELVATSAAEEQLQKETGETDQAAHFDVQAHGTNSDSGDDPARSNADRSPTRFSGVVVLDSTKGALTAAQIFENIISELERADGAIVRLTLEIHAEAPAGFDADIVDVVVDNSKTLGFDQNSFD